MVLRFDQVTFGLLAIVLVMYSAQQQAKADKSVVLTEQEILTQIIENTASGASAKRRGRSDDGPIRDNGPSLAQRCASFMSSLEMLVAGDVGCRTISVEGNEIAYHKKGKHSMTGTLLKGNPKNH